MLPPPPRIQGLPNTSGTACHISSPIVLLCYTIPPIRDIFLEATSSPGGGCPGWIRALGAVIRQLIAVGDRTTANDSDNNDYSGRHDVVDPTPLYQALSRDLGMEARDLGDAATALTKILGELRQQPSEDDPLLFRISAVVEAAIGTGRIRTVIQGHNNTTTKRRRTKTLKLKPMSVPLTLPVVVVKNENEDSSSNKESKTSLQYCFGAYRSPVPIQGYQWVEGTYQEEDADNDDDQVRDAEQNGSDASSSSCWITTKQNVVETIPCWWILHLDRFVYDTQQHSVQPVPIEVDIPLQFVPRDDDDDSQHLYSLVGAILHVKHHRRHPNEHTPPNKSQEGDEEEEEENGHYVALISSASEDTLLWFLVDDDQVTPLSNDTVLQTLLLGRSQQSPTKDDHDDEQPHIMRAVVLVYQREDAMACIQPILEQNQRLLQEFRTNQDQEYSTWIGRRLRVKWSKKKWYAGVIAHYDSTTQTHTIHYDDGDIKTYILSQKTIEWEE